MKKLWITSAEAAKILSDDAGRQITASYVRILAKLGKVRTKEIDERTKLYHRGDCEAYHVSPRTGQRVSDRVRDRRKGTPPGRPRKIPDAGV